MPKSIIDVHVGAGDAVTTEILKDPSGVVVNLHASGADVKLTFDPKDIHVLRRLGVACIEAVYSFTHRAAYEPTGPVLDGIEVGTGRWVCCGAIAEGAHADYCLVGPDDPRDAMAPAELADADVTVR